MIHTDGFDDSKWQVVNAGYIAVWQSGLAYETNIVVTRGNSMLRCKKAHMSTDFNNAERNNWDLIAGKGALIPEWQPGVEYGIDEAVICNDVIYRSNINHISGGTFGSDMIAGLEKWRAVNGGDGLGSMRQVTKLGVIAPKAVEVVIKDTNTFNLPPVEILKFTPGLQNQVKSICSFDNSDAGDFMVGGESGDLAKYVTFDGTMQLKTEYVVAMGDPVALDDGFICESEEIDFGEYKKVEKINLEVQ